MEVVERQDTVMNRNSFWMTVSGITGFGFFLIANFTSVFVELSVVAGFCQLAVNTFVFVIWSKAFRQSSGFKKFVAFFGVIVPLIMASVTVWRVLLPWMYSIK